MEKNILIVEDETIAAHFAKDRLHSLGYHVTIADNGLDALELFKKYRFPIIITDYGMPTMNGAELIQKLKTFEEDPIIFVLTSHFQHEIIIKIMKLGIFDYLIKPFNLEEISLKIKKAFEYIELRNLERVSKKERQIRLEGHLDWIQWKERMGGQGDFKKINQNLFHSLQTSFCQGAGFGGLITLLKIISDSATREDQFYKIDIDMMDLINENVAMAEKALDCFTEIDEILTTEYTLNTFSVDKLYSSITETLENSQNILTIKSQKSVLSDRKAYFETKSVSIDIKLFQRMFDEILINACKFSLPNSNIYITLNIELNQLVISCFNQPIANTDGSFGIPTQYENIIFEPFFRLTKFVFEGYGTLDFGLGLTLVDAIIKKLNAKIEIRNIRTHFSDIPEDNVLVRLSFPLN